MGAAKKLFLKKENRKKRLSYAKLNKTSEGESKFETFSSNCTEDDTGVR